MSPASVCDPNSASQCSGNGACVKANLIAPLPIYICQCNKGFNGSLCQHTASAYLDLQKKTAIIASGIATLDNSHPNVAKSTINIIQSLTSVDTHNNESIIAIHNTLLNVTRSVADQNTAGIALSSVSNLKNILNTNGKNIFSYLSNATQQVH
jgi:hypothetical protein